MPEELDLIVDLGVQDDGEPAVVETALVTEKVETPEVPAETQETKPEEQEKPHKKPGSVRARERAEKAEAEVAEARRRVAELEEQIKAPKPANDPDEPALENFEDLASWRVALADFHRKKAAEETEARFKAEQSQREFQAKQAAWREADAKFSADKPDWEDVMEDLGDAVRGMKPETHPGFQALDAALSASDIAPALKYHFGKHPEELAAMAQMDPIRAVKALARLEDKLGNPSAEPPKPRTNAPKPVVPVTAPAGGRVLEDGLLVY